MYSVDVIMQPRPFSRQVLDPHLAPPNYEPTGLDGNFAALGQVAASVSNFFIASPWRAREGGPADARQRIAP